MKYSELFLKRRPYSPFVNFLAGDLAFKMGDETKGLIFWKKAFKEADLLLRDLRTTKAWLKKYAEILIAQNDLEGIRLLSIQLMKSHVNFTTVDPEHTLGFLYQAFPNTFAEEVRDLQIRLTPQLKYLKIRPIEELSSQTIPLFESYTMHFTDPHVFQESAPPAPRQVQILPQKLDLLVDVQVTNSFQVLKDDTFVLYEPAGHPEHGLVAGTWRNFCVIPETPRTHVLRVAETLEYLDVDEAILLSGRASENYFHWIVEYLPRLFNVIQAQLPKTIPLLIKAGLPAQFYQALETINPGYPVQLIDPSKNYFRVKKLWVPSFQTLLTDSFEVPFWKGAGVSDRHMNYVRDQALKMAGLTGPQPPPHRMIYLARKSTRNISNASELETYLQSRGFELIFTERLSFKEQVQLFHQSKIVVGPTGAAMANILFMQPKTVVVGLISERYKDYALKATLANLVGSRFMYVTGKNVRPRSWYKREDEYAQSNFRIPTKVFKKCIEQLLKSET